MYSTCLFCSSALGANESIESFPTGRRLAFDGEKGRLWVICPACARWNLSPLEERWEAIEACERAFRGTRLRTSTENIGMARLADGTELVRVGRPMRPEFAAWRYGAVMTGRMRRANYQAGALISTVLTLGAIAAVGPVALLAGAPLIAWTAGAALDSPGRAYDARRARHTLRTNSGELLLPRDHLLLGARIKPGRALAGGWALQVQTIDYPEVVRAANQGLIPRAAVKHELAGAPAMRAMAVLMADANTAGGTRRQVDDAVRLIQRSGTPERWFAQAEHDQRRNGWGYRNVWEMAPPVRLALEMASHEEAERRAMEGELAELETAWRDAEELAAISDALLVPPDVERKLRQLRATEPRDAPWSAPQPVTLQRPRTPPSPAAPSPRASGLRAAREEYARKMAARRASRSD